MYVCVCVCVCMCVCVCVCVCVYVSVRVGVGVGVEMRVSRGTLSFSRGSSLAWSAPRVMMSGQMRLRE